MSELQIHESVFPFQCANDNCKHKFDLDEFCAVIRLWGFIYLTNKSYMLLGITCPDCMKTTLQKYQSPNDFPLFEIVNRENIKNMVVPFSPQIILNLSLIPNFDHSSDDSEKFSIANHFYVPTFYPETFTRQFPFTVAESNIQEFLKIENEFELKVFPRIASDFYPCKYTEQFFRFMNEVGEIDAQRINELNRGLYDEIYYNSRYHRPANQTEFTPPDPDYKHMINDDLSNEEFQDLDLNTNATDNLETFLPRLQEFGKEFVKVRNRINFEIIYKKELLNRYARLLYIKKGSAEDRACEALDMPVQYQEEPTVIILKDNATQEKVEKKAPSAGKVDTVIGSIENEAPILNKYENAFYRHGKVWLIKFRGMSTTVSDTPRIRYVAHLLAEPYERINNQWLVRAVGEKGFKAQGAQFQFDKDENDGQPKGIDGLQISKYADSETGTNLSKRDIRKFRETLLKLLDESIMAEKNNDKEKVEGVWQEINRVVEIIQTYNAETIISKDEKKGTYNVSIKTRHHDKNFERARINVRNNITNALKTISEHLPALGKNLDQSIKTTSTNAVYNPQRDQTNKSIKWYVSF